MIVRKFCQRSKNVPCLILLRVRAPPSDASSDTDLLISSSASFCFHGISKILRAGPLPLKLPFEPSAKAIGAPAADKYCGFAKNSCKCSARIDALNRLPIKLHAHHTYCDTVW